MSSKSAVITTRIYRGTQADALVDTRCNLYALIDHDLAYKLRLPIVDCSKRVLGSFSDSIGATKAIGVVVFNLKLCGYNEKIFAHKVRAISLADIQKALMKKTEKADLKALLPPAILAEFRKLFQPDEAANLPPHRPGVDHRIPIKQDESEQQLSTAYYLQTDRGLERINQEIQAYLCNYATYSQKD
ncbi:hypothetical protein CGCA056_v008323 [Colletotrichum aenigma]|uniref:uncharacterized protein n=1 Tax=Colletotrichum aenigma TaxID=1215731 RepID=UPI0018730F79|nr:uncharacterized protein CGCA056_v008323 [Colletotrichum aenigma]KAF5519955.1 hypothetical protein CGCA056_v008323 [Colletotrichum aenigma]